MLISAKMTRKIWTLALVSRRLWAEVAIWQTAMSDLKGWQACRRPGGFRVVTPLLGMAMHFSWVKEDEV